MAGHIALPAYQKVLDPSLQDTDIMPATLAPELLQDLLKTRLGFNGLVVTDASHMLGTAAMRREDYVPGAIAAGCDMFLFFNDMDEDFEFMVAGVGLKAKLDLVGKRERGELLRTADVLQVIGSQEHLDWRADSADKSITLVKNTLDQLPIRPEIHKRIRLYYLDQAPDGVMASTGGTLEAFQAELEGRGFEVTVNDGGTRVKGPTLKYRDEVDAAIVVANIIGYAAENNYRIRWKVAMSTDVPWHVHEVPTVMVSLSASSNSCLCRHRPKRKYR